MVHQQQPPVTPPDGGWGWVVVFASFMIHVIADGVMYAFGVFYVDLNKQFGSSKAESAWIASIMTSVTFGAGPLVSALVNRYGCRVVCVVGAFTSGAAFMVSTLASSVEVMYATLGLLLGSGLGLMYLPAIVSVTCYFEKKRAFATGIAVCGSGIGTFLMAPLTDMIITSYGWKNTMYILAAILSSCSVFGFLLRPLHPPKCSTRRSLQDSQVKTSKPVVQVANVVASQNASNVTRNLSDINLVDRQTDESGAGARDSSISRDLTHNDSNTSGTCNGECFKFATSQPLLTGSKTKDQTFGSHDVMHLYSPSKFERPASTHLEVMTRKDIFYSGSLVNIPAYRSNPEMYERSRRCTAAARTKSRTGSTVTLFGCTLCPEDFVATLRDMTSAQLLKNPVFMLFAASNFFTSIGYYVPYVYIVDKAIQSGVSRDKASYLLSIVGICNTAARIILGYISDRPKINRLYLYNAALTIAGVGTALNALCNDFMCLAVYAAVFGLAMGAYVGLTSVILVDLLGLDWLTNAFGLLLLFQGVASLIGPPVTGVLYDNTQSYNAGFLLSGAMIALSGLMLFLVPCVRRDTGSRSSLQTESTAPSPNKQQPELHQLNGGEQC